MCGIIGLYGENDKDLLKKMTNSLIHRGPDSFGYYTDKEIMLGHRRLSIIDLSKKGKQPMSNKDGNIWITYNGEIYNYLELRKILEEKGYKFKSNTDTEVIIYCYQEYGIDFLKRLDGMFAFGIWDYDKGELILARDNVGIKPLFYSLTTKGIIFSSEIKALLLHPEVKAEKNMEAINFFLHLDYYPGDKTFFKNIFQLVPGEYLTFKKVNGKQIIKKQKYWDLLITNQGHSEDFFVKKYDQILDKTIKNQMISDVPIGAYLSGGIDSTTIVEKMSKIGKSNNQKVKTFSIGFGMDDDELNDANLVASHFDTEHHEIQVQDTSLKLLPKLIWHMDEPKRELTHEFLLSKFAKTKATVILSGLGGDELFGGYIRHKYALKRETLKKLIPKAFRFISNPLYGLFEDKSLVKRGFLYLKTLHNEPKNYLSFAPRQIYDEDIEKLMTFTSNSKKVENYFERLLRKHGKTTNYFDRVLYTELKSYLPSHLLAINDRQTMANSLECRVPLLGKDMVNFAFTLPPNMKIKSKTGKYIMRKYLHDKVPKRILEKKKQGFRVNPKKWLNGELGEYAKQTLTKKRIEKEGYFKWNYVDSLLNQSHKVSNSKEQYKNQDFKVQQLWNLLSYHLWEDIYIKKSSKQNSL